MTISTRSGYPYHAMTTLHTPPECDATGQGSGISKAGSKVAFDVAEISNEPTPGTANVRVTRTVTVRFAQDRSTRHTHDTRVAPLRAAKTAASLAGDPVAPKGLNVTGAAAKAAASAALEAAAYAASPAPDIATPTASISTRTAIDNPTRTDPASPFGSHR